MISVQKIRFQAEMSSIIDSKVEGDIIENKKVIFLLMNVGLLYKSQHTHCCLICVGAFLYLPPKTPFGRFKRPKRLCGTSGRRFSVSTHFCTSRGTD